MARQSNQKAALLSKPIQHIDIQNFDSTPLIEAMDNMSFSSRDLSKATTIFNDMLRDKDCTIILTLAGSTSAAGCMKIYSDLVKYNIVDVIVATGASIVDMDFFEALGFRHYQAEKIVSDEKLRSLYINRIYDTYIDEKELQICDKTISKIAKSLQPRPYSSREFIAEMGRWLVKHGKKRDSLVQTAYEHGVPIFCQAFTDSSAGFGLVHHQAKNPKKHLTIDSVKDLREITEIKIRSRESGIVMIGGGVTKNFAQDTVICAEILGRKTKMHKYAIQITVADVRDGSCSSSTLKEASSWGKVDTAKEQMIYAEATTVLPLIASQVFHGKNWEHRKRFQYNRLLEELS